MKKTIEDWAAQKGTPDWLMAAAKYRSKWGQGREVSEGDFDAAVAEAGGIKLSGYADQQKLQKELERESADEQAQREARQREEQGAKTLQEQIAEQPATTETKEG